MSHQLITASRTISNSLLLTKKHFVELFISLLICHEFVFITILR